jgi:hypothetical protein
MTQSTTPVQKQRNIDKEISLVDFVFQALIAWGKKEIVVKTPAVRPT